MQTTPPSYARILRFWLPLAGTWLMMSVEGPLLAAVIARLAEPKANLAAYGVAFAFAIIVEAPVIMLMSASTALARGAESTRRLWRFTLFLNAWITLVMLVIVVPGVFGWIADLLNLPADVAALTQRSLLYLLPWPAAIGDRRFHQGLLIRADRTRRVAYGTVARVVAMATTALLLARHGELAGAHVGALALSAGVLVEMLAVRLMVRGVLADLRRQPEPDGESPPGYREIGNFYLPLALTSVLALAVQPMVTFFMGQSRMALESLAVLPVIGGLTFIFRSLGLSYQEVALALFGKDGGGWPTLWRFAAGLAALTAACLSLVAFTPLSRLWFGGVSGLSPELTAFALDPLRVMALLPALSVLLSLQRALLIQARDTAPVSRATVVEVVGIALGLALGIHLLDWVGALAAAAALMAGRVAGNLYLLRACGRAVRSFRP